ncbi:ABC transporter ATP-binding protein [Alkalibacillus haloalkaliphilus]|uniref:ABC transporter ATP-binding protein n=1 Tax=Alkalibacillus haloalkaliphilus TaxID=94136 RepID=UPI002935476F|nr:ABC transporter ATP-binding protein [Alkalibacillus haloalkaliphilus]MDV2581650.1 ABC transporter ATP-binding protein [Alkalibacillus haloalkaliphilus]
MIINVDNVKKKYKKEWVLKDINMKVEEPNIIALVGPNGSGKTTLLNCMTNILKLDEGSITLLGQPHTDSSIFKEVSYLQDNRILYGHLTAYDHLKFICDVQKIPYEKIKEVTDRVGMSSYVKRRVQNFSLGMKQHLLLAMAIINQPKILLMDEPLNGLDPTSAINMREILLQLYEKGTTVFVSSHNLDEIDRLTHNIHFMKDGALLKESLKDMDSVTYSIKTNDDHKANLLLKENAIDVQLQKNRGITFSERDVSLQHVMKLLHDHDFTISSVDNKVEGAEKRYRELFEEGSV